MPREKDKVKGKMEQVGGKAKEEVGKLGGDTDMQIGGKVEQARGKLREDLSDIRSGVEHREPEEDLEHTP
jgi:uncharacterized protein YjbJ (UPF0337 family)